VLGETGSRGVHILGGLPSLPSGPTMYDLLFATLSRSFPDCGIIGMNSISTESPLWQYLENSRSVRELFDVHVPDGIQLCHTVPLPPSFQEYIGRFSAKKRYNLMRQMRQLREHGEGDLELRRIEFRHQIPDFVKEMRALEESAWPPGCRRPFYAPVVDGTEFARLADRGLLLCHVLFCGGRPCASSFGMVYERRHYLHSFLRDRNLDRFSPGTTLFHLVVEDLIRRGSVDLIDLGFGEPHYTHSSTNVTEPRATVWLLRKTVANRMRRWGHAVFRSTLARLKWAQRTIRARTESNRR
jgi:CelD/BcsL family acetyltransferase involved in cellulose biosynthesis